MSNFSDFAATIREMAVQATECGNPTRVYFGTVTQCSPLEILLEQRLRLPASVLVLSRNVTDYDCDYTVNHRTEIAENHTHAVTGRKTFKTHHKLAVGEKVILLQAQGGQKYIVLDRVVDA